MNESIWMTNHLLPNELREEWKQMNASKHNGGLLEKFNDLKLGMFIHWGLYSIPSGMWKGNPVQGLGEWIQWHADIPRAEYAQLASELRPDKFDAAEWVSLAKRTGMTYIVVTAKHHDGFALWDSAHSDYTISKKSPSDLEPLDRLYEECQKQGIGFGLYYSHVIDWYDGWEGEGGSVRTTIEKEDTIKDNPMNTWDPPNVSRRHYFETKAYPQLEELLDRYPNLHCIWFDYWYEGKYLNPPEAFKFYKMVYDKQPNCLVNSRVDGYERASKTLGDYITTGDNVILEPGQDVYWETPGTLNNTWGYSSRDNDWKGEVELLYWLIGILSRGGNYLLNIGPRPDGSIPEGTYTGFDHITRWLAVNSEAVYGSKAWKVDHEGQEFEEFDGTADRLDKGFQFNITSRDIWFTTKGDAIFAISLVRPDDNRVVITSMNGTPVKSVSVVGIQEPVDWELTGQGLVATLPDIDNGTIGYTLKIVTS